MVDDYRVITPSYSFYLQGDNRSTSIAGIARNCGITSIQSVREAKSSNITVINIPFQDTSANLGWDYLGVKREYTIDAIVTGSEDDITRYIWLLNQVINGQQYDKTITLTYKYGRSMSTSTGALSNVARNVIFKDFIINYEKSSEGRLNYTLTIEEAKRS